MSAYHVYLDRLRGNVALALAEGASPAEVQAHVLSAQRHAGSPTVHDHLDGQELAEKAAVLTGFRSHQPGEVPVDE